MLPPKPTATVTRRAAPVELKVKRGMAVTVLLAALAILVLPALREAPTYDQIDPNVGYPAMTRELVEVGLLRFGTAKDPEGTGRVVLDRKRLEQLASAPNGPDARLGSCQTGSRLLGLLSGRADVEDCLALFRRYKLASFLRDDMRFVTEDIWQSPDGRLAGATLTAHTPPSVASGGYLWQGRVDFARPQQGLYLIESRSRQPVALFSAAAARSGNLPIEGLEEGLTDPVEAREVLLGVDSKRPCAGAAKLGLLGDVAVLTLLPGNSDANCPTVWLDNEEVQNKELISGGRRYRLVLPGQTVALGYPGSNPVRLQLVRGLGALSLIDGNERRFEPTLAPIGSGIAGARPALANVISSIDPVFHSAAQRLLELQGKRELDGERASFRAGAVLVDAMTGEVVAAPTFPTRRGDLVKADQTEPNRLSWLGKNTNLERLPVGSMAKVPLAAAITHVDPELLELKTNTGGRFRSVLGRPIPIEYGDHGGIMDFRRFIVTSSNGYAFTLMALAASANPTKANGQPVGNDRYFLKGAWQTRASSLPLRGDVFAGRWSAALWPLLCVEPYHDASQSWYAAEPDAGCRPGYLRSVPVSRSFGAIRHVSPDLALHSINRKQKDGFYQDYLMSIIGGGRSTWTNMALAQAYARILRNRAVTLRFDKRTPEESATGGFAKLNLNPKVWNAVLGGMAGVVSDPEGTAHNRLDLAKWPELSGMEVFAKTGTSTVVRYAGETGLVEQGHGVAIAFARSTPGSGSGPDRFCSMRLIVVNFEDRDVDKTPGLTYVNSLLAHPAIRAWIARPCRSGTSATKAVT